jgi:hypothetical protein
MNDTDMRTGINMNRTELALQADSLKSDLDKLDELIDTMSDAEALALSKVYESLGIILKAQRTLIKNKPGLKLISD